MTIRLKKYVLFLEFVSNKREPQGDEGTGGGGGAVGEVKEVGDKEGQGGGAYPLYTGDDKDVPQSIGKDQTIQGREYYTGGYHHVPRNHNPNGYGRPYTEVQEHVP